MKLIERYLFTEAKWWQFWMPQSGPAGGAVFGILFVLALFLLAKLFAI